MIKQLKHKLKAIALAEAILSPEWQYRYFSYNCNWGENQELASMRNGEGGEWFLLFFDQYVAYKAISQDDGFIEVFEIKNQIPEIYHDFLDEPAFSPEDLTAFWFLERDQWRTFGKERVRYIIDLEQILRYGVEEYHRWAEEYYEQDIDLKSLKELFNHNIDEKIVQKLNPDLKLADLKSDLKEINF